MSPPDVPLGELRRFGLLGLLQVERLLVLLHLLEAGHGLHPHVEVLPATRLHVQLCQAPEVQLFFDLVMTSRVMQYSKHEIIVFKSNQPRTLINLKTGEGHEYLDLYFIFVHVSSKSGHLGVFAILSYRPI